ncbi:MAG TPA: PAS domain S-box protein [Clostridia bacterium]|nr:PAS domain S-box protein [Clostridia bacterium]
MDKPMLNREEILRILINYTPDLIFFKDAEGRYLEINDSSLELFGFDKSKYKGMKRQQLNEMSLLYGQISGNCGSSDQEAWEKGSIINFTETIILPGGEKRTYDVIKSPVYYEDGRRKGLVTLARDISVYKSTEEKLERKEKILRATLNATDDGILVADRNRQVLEANEPYYHMWNIPWDIYSLNSETANTIFIMKQLVDPGSFEAWVNCIYKAPASDRHQVRLLDGRIIDVYSAPLMDKGDIMGMVWSFRDVSARVMAEEKLHVSEERYRILVELSPDGIFVIVRDKIMFANAAGLKILGAGKIEDIYQQNIFDFMDKDRTIVKRHFDNIVSRDVKQCSCNNSIVQLSGKSIEVEAVCTAVHYMGENAVVCIMRDVSENRKNEELKRKIDENIQLVNETLEYDKIRTEYFANISHEIKTPLNVIIGTLQLFELVINEQNSNESSDRLLRYTSIMKQNGFRLLRMFNNLIYITEIDSGFIEMNYHNYDLVPIVRDLLSASGRFIRMKGANLKTNITCPSIELACDAGKIKRILLNLLSNAIKFTEKGDDIIVSLYRDKEAAYISVKDTGIGIQDNMKELIFERFRQVDQSFTRKCEGSGIGLYLAKSLTEMHGGSIEVKSEFGKGSEFIVRLPLWLVETDEIAAASEETSSAYMDMASIEFSDIY